MIHQANKLKTSTISNEESIFKFKAANSIIANIN